MSSLCNKASVAGQSALRASLSNGLWRFAFFSAFLAFPLASSASLSDGLVAYWNFDDSFAATIGGNEYDLTGIGDDGGPVIDQGFSRFGGGSARFLREHEQYLEGLTPFDGGSYTFSAWYWLDLDQIPVGSGGAKGSHRYEVLSATTSNDTFPASYSLRNLGEGDIGQVFSHFVSPASSPHFNFDPGPHQQWTNIIVTYDSSADMLRAYLNGVVVGLLSVDGALRNSDVIRIGNGRVPVRWWDGWIDEVGVWDRVLTPTEIARLQVSTFEELFADRFEHQPLNPGDTFSDCADCPTMVKIPAGIFTQGSPESDPDSGDHERPQREVNVPAFALGQTEVTFDQWDACVDDGGCKHFPFDNQAGRGNRPVIYVSWDDAQEYVIWLSARTGQDYRLPSESEREYATRAGTTGRYNTGDCITTDQANFLGTSNPAQGCPTGIYRELTLPVASFAPNAFGLYDTHGNVWEWMQDCWNDDYEGAPTDGSAWMSSDCSLAVLRGGAWHNFGGELRSANRNWLTHDIRDDDIGFRVARSVAP